MEREIKTTSWKLRASRAVRLGQGGPLGAIFAFAVFETHNKKQSGDEEAGSGESMAGDRPLRTQ